MNIIYYLIVFFEGYTTLSVEIIALRKSMSVIGSNSITTSIILGVILVALSYGYYIGGKKASNNTKEKIIKILFINLLLAAIIYTVISFPFENILLEGLLNSGIGYSLSILLSTFILFFIPVFLASQTIPLLNELIEDNKKTELVGRLLFYSTIGSFIGSVATSIVFFPLLGVTKTIILNGLILSVLSLVIIILNKKVFKEYTIFISIFFVSLFTYLLAIDIFNKNLVYSYSTTHNDIEILDYDENKRIMLLNRAQSSGINTATKESYFSYIKETQKIVNDLKPKNILVIGGAGFTFPYYVSNLDFVEKVDVCDIDKDLYDISQKYFLEEKFNEKINFYSLPARYLVNQKAKSNEKYDFIFIDAYAGKTIPSQLLTKEFYDGLKSISSGTIAFNYIFDQAKSSNFYKSIINTLHKSFNVVSVKNVSEFIGQYGNFIVLNHDYELYKTTPEFNGIGIYTDNLGTQEIDKYNLFKENYKKTTNKMVVFYV